MKTGKFSFISKGLTALIFTLFTINSSGQVFDSTIVKTGNLKKDDILFLESSLGDINVKTWDKSEIRVEYVIYVVARSKKDLSAFRKKFNLAIEDQLKDGTGKVYASIPFETLSRNQAGVKITFKDDEEKFDFKELKCSLQVSMPGTNALNLRSNFNTVAIENLNSNATIDVNSTHFKMGDCKALTLKANFSKNMEIGHLGSAVMNINSCDIKTGMIDGDLSLKSNFSHIEIEKIGNKANLDLNSGSFETSEMNILEIKGNFIRNFRATNIDQAKISLNSSEFEAGKINSMNVERASFSTFKIDEVTAVKISASTSSTFNIEKANSIESGSCNFSKFNINHLTGFFKTTANSGNVEIKNVASGFDEINIKGSFVDIDVHIAENSNYLLTADLNFPKYNFSGMVFDNHETNFSHELIKGSKGDKKLATSKINFVCQSCNITVY